MAGLPLPPTGVVAPGPQSTAVLGCTLTGPGEGSVAVTVSSSVVQAMPKVRESAWLAAEAGRSGPRSRGSSETVSPTVTILPSSAWRSVAAGIDPVACAEPLTEMRLPPWTVAGETTTVALSRRPALDNVTSSSRATPSGCARGRETGHRRGAPGADKSDPIPFPQPECGEHLGMQPHHAAAGIGGGGIQTRGKSQISHR